MNVLKTVALGLALCAFTAQAKNHYWQGGSASWHDASHWDCKTLPTLNDACFIEWQKDRGPVEITFDGTNAAAYYLDIVAKSGVTDNSQGFEQTVYLRGKGETMNLMSGGSFYPRYGRKLVVDHLNMHNGAAYLYCYGKLSVINQSNLCPDFDLNEQGKLGSSYFIPGYAGSRAVFDNSFYHPFCTSPASGGGELVIRHNAHLEWDRSWTAIGPWAALKIDFSTGEVITSPTYTLRNHGLLPKRTGGVLWARNTTGTEFTTTGDTRVRLGGEAWFTNSLASYTTVTFTNSVTMYGRGKLHADIRSTDWATNVYDLSQISLRKVFQNENAANPVTLLGDTLFEPEGTLSNTLKIQGDLHVAGPGTRTFDALEKFGRKDKKRDIEFTSVRPTAQASMVFKNAGTVTMKYFNNEDTLGSLELGADVAFNANCTGYYYLKFAYENLKLGAGSTLTIPNSQNNAVVAYGEASFDPTSTISRGTSARGEGAIPYFLLATLDSDVTPPQFVVSTPSSGWSVHRVGGTFFYGDGKYKSAKPGNYAWTGEEDGLWSNTNNWGNHTMPDSSHTAYFEGFRNTVVTNDLNDAGVLRLWNCSNTIDPGPFILRGKKITVAGANQQIRTTSVYPFIIESDIAGTTTGEFQVMASGDNANTTLIVLRGKVSVADGTFSPDGLVFVDGAVTAKNLKLRNWTGRTYTDIASGKYHTGGEYPTQLRITKNGTLAISNQTTVNSETGSLFIAKGGKVGITGDWKHTNCENAHIVDGTLEVSGALGGDVMQGYFGSGCVKTAMLDGSEGASIKLGDGVTLMTTTAGTTTMPIVMARGEATIAPMAELTIAGGIKAEALGHTLTISNAVAVKIAGALTGYDFDFVKAGAGRLELAEAAGLTNGYTKIAGGTLALTKPTTMGQLTASAGTTLEFVAKNGTAPLLTLNDDLDLTGLKFKVTGEVPTSGWVELVRVGEDLKITGTPVNNPEIRTKIVTNLDDTVSVYAHVLNGTMWLVR